MQLNQVHADITTAIETINASQQSFRKLQPGAGSYGGRSRCA